NRGLQALPLVAGVLVVLAILLTLSGLLGLGGLARALAPLGASTMPSSTPTLIVIPTATPAPTPTVTPTPTNDDRLADLWRQLDGAWAQNDWPETIRLIKQAQEIDPSYGDSTNKLFSAYFNYAMQMVEKDQLVQAVIFLDEALKLIPDDVNAQGERRLAMLYVEGEAHYNAGNWDEAINKFAAIYEEDPDYKGDMEKLYASYYNKGYALERTGRLVEAKQQYQLALQVNPNGPEAKAQLARLIAILTPPTPTPTPVPPEAKRIEVNLTTQRLIAWEGSRAVYQFPVTTGRPGSPTLPGSFQIRDKIASAYSNIWRLQLPYWMGIYWAGPIENGFHALPVDKNGNVLWGENLGVRPSSYGCIVLATADAAKLFNWANVGTRVSIHY
ncbi:MAG: L,D-transpeptidase family protein, partial [Chloroflexota bacterium]